MGRLAAIDAGSTSVHLLVADVRADGTVSPIVDESAFAGLGEAIEARGRLGEAGATDLAGLLAGYARRATDLEAHDVLVLATAPLRRAADAARVVRCVEREAGLAVHVLTEREEALLTLLGATGGILPSDGVALVDIGGGSTELVVAAHGARPWVAALPVGAATLAGRQEMRDDALRLVDAPSHGGAGTVLAVGGTADNLARVSGRPRLTRDAIASTVARLTQMSAEQASATFGVRPARARLLPAGAAILLAVMDRWRVDAVDVAPGGLREGAILALTAAGRGWRDRLETLAAGEPPPSG